MRDVARLIERLEKLDGPDREVDARIAVTLGDVIMRGNDARGFAFFRTPLAKGDWAFLSGCKNGEDDAYRSLGQCLNVKHYTASLDAAIALTETVLPGCGYTTDHQPVYGKHHDASVFSEQVITIGNGRGPTAAIALCLALLRALQPGGRS